MKADGQTNK